MKRLMILLAALLLCVPHVRADGTADEWAMILAALASDVPNPVPTEYQFENPDPSPAPGKDPQVMNLLLLGTDAEDMARNRGRSDVMLVCSVRRDTGAITLTALPETAMAPVDGLPGPVRLKYVNCFGGPLRAMRQVNRLLGLNVERYCAVNYASFILAVDTLGGVELELSAQECEAVGVPEHTRLLQGEQALRYVKLRWGEAVTDRPRKLLDAVHAQLRRASADTVFSLAETLLSALDTNITTSDLMDLLFILTDPQADEPLRTEALSEALSWQENAALIQNWLYP